MAHNLPLSAIGTLFLDVPHSVKFLGVHTGVYHELDSPPHRILGGVLFLSTIIVA